MGVLDARLRLRREGEPKDHLDKTAKTSRSHICAGNASLLSASGRICNTQLGCNLSGEMDAAHCSLGFCACFGVALRRTGGGQPCPFRFFASCLIVPRVQSLLMFASDPQRPFQTCAPYLSSRAEFRAFKLVHSRIGGLAKYIPNRQVARKNLAWPSRAGFPFKERENGGT